MDAEIREPPRKRCPLKSGKVGTADSMVVKVIWPCELVYTALGQSAMYEALAVTLFLTGYLAVMETIKPTLKPVMRKHLKKLIANAQVYGWALVRAYRTVWLQQIENGRAKWTDAEVKLEFHRALMGHASPPTIISKQTIAASSPRGQEV